MNQKNIDIFLTAKKQQIRTNLLTLVSITVLILYAILLIKNINYEFFDIIAVSIFIIGVLVNSDFKFFNGKLVSRQELLNIIESWINDDAEAIKYINTKNSHKL